MEPTKPKNFPEPPQQSLYQVFKQYMEKNKKWLVMFMASSILAMVCSWQNDTPKAHGSEPLEIDIMIPSGFVLLPIEVENYESLDSVLGQMGVVDLYQNQAGSNKRSLVASFVRILRNPHNPNQFSILVPEKNAALITNHFGPYFVSLRPRKNGTGFEKREFELGTQAAPPRQQEVYYVE